jgi:phospholipid N-methyltransferase
MSVFFKQAISNIKQMGSFVPSSGYLAQKMIAEIDFEKDLNILELGAGDGIFTKYILSKMTATSVLTSYEINSGLFNEIKKIPDPRLKPIRGSVLHIADTFADCSVDYIISGIPLANIKKRTKKRLLDSCFKLLKPNGLYVQFQYLPRDYKLIKETFGGLKFGFTPFNFPPAFIYYASKY